MNTEFKTYLISMGLDSEVTLKNADKILGIASKLCPEEIKDIFISEFRKDNGSREYESMWLFSDNFILEVRNFRSEIDIDMSNNKPIVYFRVQMKGFDYENDPGELSRVSLEAGNADSVIFMMKASWTNCNKLVSLIGKYIKAGL